jgi:hypothetical protein
MYCMCCTECTACTFYRSWKFPCKSSFCIASLQSWVISWCCWRNSLNTCGWSQTEEGVLGPLSLSVPWRRNTWNAHKWEIFHKSARELLYMQYIQFCQVPIQEAKYVESWPNTTSAWAGWRGFDIPVDRADRVHSLLQCTEVSYPCY